MEPMVVKPRKALRTIWLISWAIPFTLGLLLCLILAIFLPSPHNTVLPVGLGMILAISLPVPLWISAYYRSIEWIVDDEVIKAKKGIFWRIRVEVPYAKICNIDVIQGPLQRMFDVGTINVYTAGGGSAQGTKAELQIEGIREPEPLKDIIMKKVSKAATTIQQETVETPINKTSSEILVQILAELTAIRKVVKENR